MRLFGSAPSSPSPQEQVDRADLADLRSRVARLEAVVAQLQTQDVARPAPALGAGGVAEPAWLGEVRDLKAQGKLINAIKVYRERTGVGLREAKDAVEGMS